MTKNDECRFVAEMVQESFGAEMRVTVYVGFHVCPIVPGRDAPPGVVGFGEGVGPQVAFGFHGLFKNGGSMGEELIEKGWSLSRRRVTTMMGTGVLS